MESSLFFSYFSLFLSLYLLTNQFIYRIQNHPPTPFFSFPIIGHLYLLKKPLHRSLAKISARHGPIVLLRLGSRSVLAVASPSAAEECFTRNDIVFANRPRILASKHLGYNHTSLVSAPYGDHWWNLRRFATLEVLSSHHLQLLSVIRLDEVRALLRRLLLHPLSSSTPEQMVDMNSVLFDMVLNVMMRMIAGKRYYGENAAEAEESRRFKEIVMETFELMRRVPPTSRRRLGGWGSGRRRGWWS